MVSIKFESCRPRRYFLKGLLSNTLSITMQFYLKIWPKIYIFNFKVCFKLIQLLKTYAGSLKCCHSLHTLLMLDSFQIYCMNINYGALLSVIFPLYKNLCRQWFDPCS